MKNIFLRFITIAIVIFFSISNLQVAASPNANTSAAYTCKVISNSTQFYTWSCSSSEKMTNKLGDYNEIKKLLGKAPKDQYLPARGQSLSSLTFRYSKKTKQITYSGYLDTGYSSYIDSMLKTRDSDSNLILETKASGGSTNSSLDDKCNVKVGLRVDGFGSFSTKIRKTQDLNLDFNQIKTIVKKSQFAVNWSSTEIEKNIQNSKFCNQTWKTYFEKYKNNYEIEIEGKYLGADQMQVKKATLNNEYVTTFSDNLVIGERKNYNSEPTDNGQLYFVPYIISDLYNNSTKVNGRSRFFLFLVIKNNVGEEKELEVGSEYKLKIKFNISDMRPEINDENGDPVFFHRKYKFSTNQIEVIKN